MSSSLIKKVSRLKTVADIADVLNKTSEKIIKDEVKIKKLTKNEETNKILKERFGEDNLDKGLQRVKLTLKLVQKRNDQKIIYGARSNIANRDSCYVFRFPHHGKELPYLGSTNLGAGETGRINFTKTVLEASELEQYQTVIHEHAHALGYSIDDLGYSFDKTLAYIEDCMPDLAIHNADSIAEAGLTLLNIDSDNAKKHLNSNYKRRKELLKSSKMNEKEIHMRYVVKNALPMELRKAWPKKGQKVKKKGKKKNKKKNFQLPWCGVKGLEKLKNNYGISSIQLIELGAIYSINLKEENFKKDDEKEVMYQITKKTEEYYAKLKGAKEKESVLNVEKLYTWLCKVLKGLKEEAHNKT